MAYKLSERLNQNKKIPSSEDGVDLGKVATVFILFGLLSLITAWVFSMETKRVFNDVVSVRTAMPPQDAVGWRQETKKMAMIGPLIVPHYQAVYEVSIASPLPVNSWSFVEGEILDAQKEYLFSFGKELWHETGYDSDGAWRESDNSYSMKVTFPKPGQYYLNLKTEGSHITDTVQVTISKKRGSTIPHIVFGIVTLLIGIMLNEAFKKTISEWAIRRGYD